MESSRTWAPSRRRQWQKDDLEDRISDLPDALLCYILSFLPTIWAVRTTVLAKRWNTLWTHLDNFDFEFCMCMNPWNPNQDFIIKFVETVLMNTNASSIRRFRLSCFWGHEISKLYAWIRTAVMRNVTEFDLSIRTETTMQLPEELFTSETLVSLTLSLAYFTGIPETVTFSSLKILKIFGWKCVVDDPVTRILAGTPVLEELCLQGVVFRNLQRLCVRCLTLKRLTISSLYPKRMAGKLVHDVVIDTPGLEYLNLKDNIQWNGVELKQLDVITYASVHFFGLEDDGVLEFLLKVSNVKHLVLFPKAGMYVLPSLPMLHNLTHLEVQIIDNWDFISSMLQCSPNLQVLTCEKVTKCSINHHRGHPVSTCEWRSPAKKPNCMSRLTRIEMKVNGCDKEMKLVKYLLKNSMVLKMMVINHSANFVKKWESRILKQLLRFPRGSISCQVEFRS